MTDANTAGEQVTLGAGTTTITVHGDGFEDGVTTQTYTVQVRAVAVAGRHVAGHCRWMG